MLLKAAGDLQESPGGEIVKMKCALLAFLKMLRRQCKGPTTYDARFNEATSIDPDNNAGVKEAVKVDFLAAFIEGCSEFRRPDYHSAIICEANAPPLLRVLWMRSNNDVSFANQGIARISYFSKPLPY